MGMISDSAFGSGCSICPRCCGARRGNGEVGACGAGAEPVVYQHFMHLGEEISIVPAFIINMAGCSLECPTCTEREHWGMPGLPVGSPKRYAAAMAGYFARKTMPYCVEWIGGEPSIHAGYVLAASRELRRMLGDGCPLIYLNTNGYFDIGLIDEFYGVIDSFIYDLKCAPGCERVVGGASDYWNVVTGNIRRTIELYPNSADDMIIRHLVMPGHVDCCTRRVIDWLAEYARDVQFNLITAFHDVRPEPAGPVSLPDNEAGLAISMAAGVGFRSLMVDGKTYR